MVLLFKDGLAIWAVIMAIIIVGSAIAALMTLIKIIKCKDIYLYNKYMS